MRDASDIWGRCYLKALDLKAFGQAWVMFEVDQEGHVIESQLSKSTTNNAEVNQCLVDEVQKIAFGRHRAKRTVVIWPFRHIGDPNWREF